MDSLRVANKNVDIVSHPPTQKKNKYKLICSTHRNVVGAVSCSSKIEDSNNCCKFFEIGSPTSTSQPINKESSVHWGVVEEPSGYLTPLNNTIDLSYQSDTEQFRVESQSLSQPRRISSTDQNFLQQIPSVASSASSDSSFSVASSTAFQSPSSLDLSNRFDNMTAENTIQKEAAHLNRLRRNLNREMREFTEEDVTVDTLDSVEPEIQRIKDKKNEYQNCVEDFVDRWETTVVGDPHFGDKWRDEIIDIGNVVKQYSQSLRAKKGRFVPGSSDRSLAIQEASLKLQELSLKEQQKVNADREANKKEEARIMAETEGNLVLGECSVLGDLLLDVSDWDDVEDEVVADAMRNLDKWQEQMNVLERSYRKFENMAVKYDFPDSKKDAIRETYEDYRDRFEKIRKAVKEEDASRALYTLEPPRSDIIKYPIFSGLPSEDYLCFKETIEQRFRENKVKRREQVAKLRECLKGAALARVPDGVTDISEAFRRLNEAFGNPSKIMGHSLKALEDLGVLPPEKTSTGQFNYSKQIEWYLKLEVVLNKILELSKRSSKLAHEAFSSATYRKIWARFPTSYIQKLVKIPGEDAERLEGIIEKIVKLREQAQLLDDECGTISSLVEKKQASKVTAEVFFRPPKRFDDCRICTHLSATNAVHSNLFENHLSNYATGCPKFIEATPEQRKNLIRKVKICSQCFHPELIWSTAHMKECPFNKKKNKFSCTVDNCKEHMWICLTHKQRNRTAMERFRQDLLNKGFNLAMTSHVPLQAHSAETANAIRKIKRGQSKKGREIVPVPSGDPLFLFHSTQGKTRPLNTFYDNGCSHAVFLEGVPGEELRGQIVCKGPFQIHGVGGLSTKALDEWVTCVKRADGKIQLIQGLTVPKVTSDFPFIQLSTAVAEIKADDPANHVLQSCKVPPMVGGAVDILLGSKYLSIFPQQVHTLPCGLTIYKSQLASHDGHFDSCIGGPHSSFSVLADLAGGTSQLIAAFVDGLQTYKQWGPPSLTSIPLSDEDVVEAKKFNSKELGFPNITEALSDECLSFEPEKEMVTDSPQKQFSCFDCNKVFEIDRFISVAHDERIREFKRSQGINESGLEIEYRCPQCRKCADCKNSDKTEKLSLREESEMFEVKKSVKLDFANRKIQCSLPLRGKERDFLSNNRERSLKTLQQQCKKYFADAATKETILAAFEKLFNNGHAKLLSDLTEDELSQFINKEVQHHLPWRVVFSSSPTTPCRPVMDASTRTPFRKDGTGGRCLNDIVCKGKIETLDLVKVLLRFTVGKFGLTGDLEKFYNACKLDPNMWNLQRFLWIKDLDPNGQVLEAIITTLIYGVKCVSAQSEFALTELADHIKEQFPDLALFLVHSRYVDDLQDSKSTQEECIKISQDADFNFEKIGLTCKAWTITGLPPSPKVSKDGLTVSAGGFAWYPEGDLLEIMIPKLHFGKPKRGRVPETVKFFGDDETSMEDFVPKNLSKRQTTSKLASVFDVLGKLAPVTSILKKDLSEVFKHTEEWDDPIGPDLRKKWIHNFLLIEKCRGLKYTRAVMPIDAINCKMRLLTGVDAAMHALVMGCWGGFRRKDNSWSNQLVIGRSILATNESIPKDELQALCGGSNLAWVVRSSLREWVESSVLFGDSKIALCWLSSENLRLSLFHRNRVLQIRRGTELDTVYHCKSEFNPADCGTRPSKVQITDIGPSSRWQNGDFWMCGDVEEAVGKGILTPISKMRVSAEDEEEFSKGLIFGEKDEIITRGHISCQTTRIRVAKVEEIAAYSNYLILPTKYKFPKLVRIYSYVMRFITKIRKGKEFKGSLLQSTNQRFSMFTCNNEHQINLALNSKTSMDKSLLSSLANYFLCNTDAGCTLSESNIHLALLYLFRQASKEVKHFTSKKVLDRISVESDGLLLSKGRLLDGLNFTETAELGNLTLGALGVKTRIPILCRYSPLSYCIGQHIHWTVGKHRGIETTNRLSLQHVSIIQGMQLYKELAEDCVRCHMKRKKLIEAPMGPVAEEQLILAPPFFVTMMDLFGPFRSFVPGFERATRGRRELESKVHILASVCVTTRAVNLQALEGKDSVAIAEGFTRLSSEVGIPTKVLVDQDSGAMAAFKSAEFDYLNFQLRLQTQYGVSFETCPTGGHDQHGLVEAIIKSIQDIFNECDLKTKRLNSLGWQTFCKLAENFFNNLPLGFSYGRQQDNTELLKIITPNMLRIGRNNNRALQGPIRLPGNTKELLDLVDSTYKAWFNVFKETVVPRLIPQPKWFQKEVDLNEEDVVYFRKEEKELNSEWRLGTIEQVIRSRDGIIRRIIIKYFNASENDPTAATYRPRFTNNANIQDQFQGNT